MSLALTAAGAAAAVEADAASAAAPAPTQASAIAAPFVALSRSHLTAMDLAAGWARDREAIAETEIHRPSHHPTRDPMA